MADEWLTLELKLLARTKARQHVSSELQQAHNALRGDASALVRTSPKPIDQLKTTNEQLSIRAHQRRVSEALRWILIAIGDAMAWRVLEYDRAAITVLGQGKRVARFAPAEGFDSELAVMDQEAARGRVVIHNDLTTCLRHGDVTAVDLDSRSVYIAEVKRSRQSDEQSPQMQRLEQSTRLINAGRIEREGDVPLNVHRLPVPYRTNLAILADLVRRAQYDGYAAARAGMCQFVEVIRFDRGLTDTEIAHRRRRARAATRWFEPGASLFEWDATRRRVRDRRESFSALAPLPLFPLEPEDLTDLVMGFMTFTVTLNADLLARTFRARGLDVTISTAADSNESFLRATRAYVGREITIEVPPYLREQMLNELVTPANVVAAVQQLADILFDESGQSSEQHVVSFSDEARVWSRARRG